MSLAARRHPARRGARPRTVAALGVLVLVAAWLTTAAGGSSAGAASAWQMDMLAQLNAFRAANGVAPVRTCPNLDRAGQLHSDLMAATNFFSHTGPDGSTTVTRAEANGYVGWTVLGENIGAGQPDVASVMSAWINSPGHRANMLDPRFTDAGFGVATGGNGVPYWSQELGAGGACGVDITGNLEQATSPARGTLSVRGWVFAPVAPTSPLTVTVTVDGQVAATVTADQSRPDVGAAFPAAGPAHGFAATFGATGGTHQVCVDARETTTGTAGRLDCRSVAVASADPFGAQDLPGPAPSGAAIIRGWAIDPDSAGPIAVHVYVDGTIRAVVTADQSRPDVGAAFPSAGAAHGYSTTVAGLAAGAHQACTYGINVAAGTNALLGCRTVVVASGNPFGNVDDVAVTGPGQILVRGWGLDPDTTAPIGVHVYVDGAITAAFSASASRPDVGAAFPTAGPDHGFATTLHVLPGNHTVCTYLINTGVGTNVLVACRGVAIAGEPRGDLNSASVVGPGTVRITGWAVDPDTTAPVAVHLYVDGRIAAATTASTSRPDVAAAFPWAGPGHGYDLTVPVGPGAHQVCAYGINIGAGGFNPLLACRSVTV